MHSTWLVSTGYTQYTDFMPRHTTTFLSLHDMPLLYFEQNQEICIPDYLPLGNVPKLVIDIPNTTN